MLDPFIESYIDLCTCSSQDLVSYVVAFISYSLALQDLEEVLSDFHVMSVAVSQEQVNKLQYFHCLNHRFVLSQNAFETAPKKLHSTPLHSHRICDPSVPCLIVLFVLNVYFNFFLPCLRQSLQNMASLSYTNLSPKVNHFC